MTRNVGQVMRASRARRTNYRVSGGVGNEETPLHYKCVSPAIGTNADGYANANRHYNGGLSPEVQSAAGLTVVANYSTFKYTPGTRARWIPSVGFTTPGRVIVGYILGPETMAYFDGLSPASKISYIRGLGNSVSFPIYEDREWMVPTQMRRKMFDVNSDIVSYTDVDVLDRSVQVKQVLVITGAPASAAEVGYVEYTDAVHVSGLSNSIVTT